MTMSDPIADMLTRIATQTPQNMIPLMFRHPR